jgi:hypothetical protein
LRVAARTYEAGLNDFADIKRDLEVAYYLMKLVKPQIAIERIYRAFEAETAHSMAVDVLFTIVDNIHGAHKRLDKISERRNWEAGEKEQYMEVCCALPLLLPELTTLPPGITNGHKRWSH